MAVFISKSRSHPTYWLRQQACRAFAIEIFASKRIVSLPPKSSPTLPTRRYGFDGLSARIRNPQPESSDKVWPPEPQPVSNRQIGVLANLGKTSCKSKAKQNSCQNTSTASRPSFTLLCKARETRKIFISNAAANLQTARVLQQNATPQTWCHGRWSNTYATAQICTVSLTKRSVVNRESLVRNTCRLKCM